MNKAIVNQETLSAWQEIDPTGWKTLVNEILGIFFSTGPQQYLDLVTAFKKQDWTAVKKIAHTLKSGCGNLGAESCHALLNEIEQLSQADVSQVPARMEKLDLIFAKTFFYPSVGKTRFKIFLKALICSKK